MTNTESLVFYLVSFSLIVILSLVYDYIKNSNLNKMQNLVLIIILILLTFISGFRYNVGTDYNSYIQMYHDFNYLELGSKFLYKIANNISNDPQTIIVLYSLITNIFTILLLKKISQKENISLIIASYLFIFFPISLNAIRQSLSISIILYSLILLKKNIKNKIPYFLLIAACLFHTSALIIFPYLIIIYKSKDKKLVKNSIIFTVSLVIALLIYFYFLKDIGIIRKIGYLGSFSLNKIDINLLISYIPFLIILLFNKSISKSRELAMYSCMFISGVILEVLFSSTQVSRIGLYFSIFLIILVPELLEKIKDENSKKIIKVLYYIFLVSYFTFVFYYYGRAEIFPYNNVFLK